MAVRQDSQDGKGKPQQRVACATAGVTLTWILVLFAYTNTDMEATILCSEVTRVTTSMPKTRIATQGDIVGNELNGQIHISIPDS
jgi:hypothetical protein